MVTPSIHNPYRCTSLVGLRALKPTTAASRTPDGMMDFMRCPSPISQSMTLGPAPAATPRMGWHHVVVPSVEQDGAGCWGVCDPRQFHAGGDEQGRARPSAFVNEVGQDCPPEGRPDETGFRLMAALGRSRECESLLDVRPGVVPRHPELLTSLFEARAWLPKSTACAP